MAASCAKTRTVMLRYSSLVGLVLAALAVGCSTSPKETTTASSADMTMNDPDQLRDAAIVTGDVVVGQNATVGYFGGYNPAGDQDGNADTWQLPYLAWRITNGAAPATHAVGTQTRTSSGALSVNVTGNFPGNPDVLVVDSDYNVIASTRAHREHGIDVATLQVDDTPGEKLVLVRDKLWVLPMSFDISVAGAEQ